MKRPYKLTIAITLLPILYATALIVAGTVDDAQASDVAIILGSKVELNGKPSARLAARLDQGALMYQRGLAPVLIVSGGVGVEGFDEAAVMRHYLTGKGIPPSAIIVDSLGNDTQATAHNGAAILRQHGWTSAIVVTQYFHVPRTRLALQREGIARVTASHPRFIEWRDMYAIVREMMALPVSMLKPANSSRR